MIETIDRLRRATRPLVQALGREPTPEELSQALDLPLERVHTALRVAREPLSLDASVGADDDVKLSDLIEDSNASSPQDGLFESRLAARLEAALASLVPREARVVRMRFGIGEDEKRTPAEIGDDLAVSRERVRQIEIKALQKLRHPSRLHALEGLLDQP